MAHDFPELKVSTRKDLSLTEFETYDSCINLTAFYGGNDRGRCLQLGIFNGVNYGSIGSSTIAHLTLEQAIQLRKQLTAFIEADYK